MRLFRTCFFGHSWKYDSVRECAMFKQKMMLGEAYGEKINFVQVRQYKTCQRCGITEDHIVKE